MACGVLLYLLAMLLSLHHNLHLFLAIFESRLLALAFGIYTLATCVWAHLLAAPVLENMKKENAGCLQMQNGFEKLKLIRM